MAQKRDCNANAVSDTVICLHNGSRSTKTAISSSDFGFCYIAFLLCSLKRVCHALVDLEADGVPTLTNVVLKHLPEPGMAFVTSQRSPYGDRGHPNTKVMAARGVV